MSMTENIRSHVFAVGLPHGMMCTMPYEEVRKAFDNSEEHELVEIPILAPGVGSENKGSEDSQPVRFAIRAGAIIAIGDVWRPDGL